MTRRKSIKLKTGPKKGSRPPSQTKPGGAERAFVSLDKEDRDAIATIQAKHRVGRTKAIRIMRHAYERNELLAAHQSQLITFLDERFNALAAPPSKQSTTPSVYEIALLTAFLSEIKNEVIRRTTVGTRPDGYIINPIIWIAAGGSGRAKEEELQFINALRKFASSKRFKDRLLKFADLFEILCTNIEGELYSAFLPLSVEAAYSLRELAYLYAYIIHITGRRNAAQFPFNEISLPLPDLRHTNQS